MTSTEREENLAAPWIKKGFEDYSTRFFPGVGRTDVERFGREFSRIILNREDVELRQDLCDLREQGCPAVAIVELMVFYTAGIHTFTDLLHLAGITDEVLRVMKQSLPLAAEEIDELRDPNEPKSPIADTFRRTAEVLEIYTDPIMEKIRANVLPLSLYLLLRTYGHGAPTLGRLLRTMRRVLHAVTPNAVYPHNFDPIVIASGTYKDQRKDPLEPRALDRRLHRFYKEFPDVVVKTQVQVAIYTGEAYATQRESGKTLLDSNAEGLEEEETPERCTNHLCGHLELSDEQKAKVLSIFRKEDDQRVQAFIGMSPSPRRVGTPRFPAVMEHKDFDSKSRQMELNTAEMIRQVLNPQQREKYDRMLAEGRA